MRQASVLTIFLCSLPVVILDFGHFSLLLYVHMKSTAYLLVDNCGPEIRHRSGLTAPDKFIYLAPADGVPTVFFDAREFGIQKEKIKQLENGVVIKALEPYMAKIKKQSAGPLVATLLVILKEYKIDTLLISASLSYSLAHELEAAGKKLVVYSYEKEREHKTRQELNHIIETQRVNERAFVLAWNILRESKIRKNRLIYRDRVLTSERLKSIIRKFFLEHGLDCPDGIIIASGSQTSRPHDMGMGPLLPNECIIIDIFPRSEKTGFFADMTRTFVKGEPSEKIKSLFTAVQAVQKKVIASVEIGNPCAQVHQLTVGAFADLGHPSSHERGFMHGTGHSLGLSIHEGPYLNAYDDRKVEPGMVFTIEPGLYYPDIGGVRIEDIVLFTEEGEKKKITYFDQPYFIP